MKLVIKNRTGGKVNGYINTVSLLIHYCFDGLKIFLAKWHNIRYNTNKARRKTVLKLGGYAIISL